MVVQARQNVDTRPFILETMQAKREDDATLLQDAGRVAALAQYTLMAKVAASGKWVPLTDVTPTLTGANLICGAIGGSLVDFAAISDGEFSITVDGVVIDITGLDFSGLDTAQDTPGFYTCGANGTNLAGWQAVTDGAFKVTVNGLEISLTGLDFSTAATLNDVADTINYAAQGRFTVVYDGKADIYQIESNTTGETSTVAAPVAPAAGTDISAAGFLNGAAAGSATAGTGGEDLMENIAEIINGAALGRFFCAFDGDAFTFVSPTFGSDSTITVLSAVSGGAGTDISGASYLNGLSGTGTPTAGAGGTGTDIPQGIYMGDEVAAADLVAGDVVDAPILIFGAVFDEDKLVLENSLDLDDVVGAGNPGAKTIRDILRTVDLIPKTTRTTSLPENA
jgi:hypothetical protein